MSKMMMIGAILAAGTMEGGDYSRKRPNVDVIEEYKLIQKKQSKLSRNDREWVIRCFNQLYKEV